MNYRLKSFVFTTFTIVLLFIWSIKEVEFINPFKQLRRNNNVIQKQEKYMTYLPHSGLHNQRISLINAMIIAKALDRTLLMPEINIGTATYWSTSDRLSRQLELCPIIIKSKKKKLTSLYHTIKCHKYRNYVPVPVATLFDLSAAHQLGIKTEQRIDLKRDYYKRHYNGTGIPLKYIIHDSVRYSYRLYDNPESSLIFEPNEKYQTHLNLDSLRDRPEPYIAFGSLFGMSRIVLDDPYLVWTREYLHRETGLNHSVIKTTSQDIINLLGANYTSVHLRQGDGVFKTLASETIQEISIALNQKLLSQQPVITTEDEYLVTQSILDQQGDRLETCLSVQHLNMPRLEIIYLATDAPSPKQQFQQLYSRYPCIFTLADFPAMVAKTKRNLIPTKLNADLLLPMIDAEVASHANLFIGTPKSTYSAYVRYRNQHYRSLDFFIE